jgi:DNA-directed RNA polymerase subunit RPC12/RpoP
MTSVQRDFHCLDCGSVAIAKPHATRRVRCENCIPGYRKAQRRAQKFVEAARLVGRLPPPEDFDCVDCGTIAVEYEHRDYRDPLNVVPTCRSCNLKRGSAKWKPETSLNGERP